MNTQRTLTESDYVPQGLHLKDYQKECCNELLTFLLTNSTRSCYNGCEPGLGKTIQTIVLVNALVALKCIPDTPHVLIICPTVAQTNWLRELKKWALFKLENCFITTHRKATTAAKDIAKTQWHVLVGDEFHYYKSRKSQRTKSFLKYLYPASVYRIALSGTPFKKCAADIQLALELMSPDNPYATPEVFLAKFCYSRPAFSGFGWDYYGTKNHELLNQILYTSILVRRLRSDVELELGKRNIITTVIDKKFSVDPSESFSTWRRQQGIAKIKPVCEYVRELLENDLPVVLFGYHSEVLAGYKEELSKIPHVFIDGSTPAKKRQVAIDDFQAGKVNLFIGQIVAAGIAVTLTAASDVVFGEFSYSPDELEQAISRLDRIGQTNTVNVHYIAAIGGIDERTLEVVQDKEADFKTVLGDFKEK